jgi:hypothetical protein
VASRFLLLIFLLLLTVAVEFSLGRKPWGVGGQPGVWSGDIRSEHNSQFIADPYSFTHITHGVLLYGLSSLALRSYPVSTRLVFVVTVESAWEVFENTDAVINRYRAETISLNYYGDSIVNSMTDILACITGFLLTARLPKRWTLVGTVMLEILLAVWIRDNLTLNIVMLLLPNDTIRVWQLGK